MNGHRRSRFGALCSILLGLSYIVVGINFVALLPADQKGGVAPELVFPSFVQNPGPLSLQAWLFIGGGMIGIAAALAIAEEIGSFSSLWVRWSTILACVGFSVTMLNDLWVAGLLPTMARQYVDGDAATKAAAVVVYPFLFLDPKGVLRFGVVGLWVLVISLIALRRRRAPQVLAYVGIAVAVLYWLLVLGALLASPLLTTLGAGLGGIICAPIWFIGMGVHLLRVQATVPQSGRPSQHARP